MSISLNQLQAMINTFGLTVTNRKDGNDEIRGCIEGRKILITVWYGTSRVTFMNYEDYSTITKQLV